MNTFERRLQAVETALKGTQSLAVQYVLHEDLRPYGASEADHLRFGLLVDRINAYAEELVNLHGMAILRDDPLMNDAYEVLTDDELTFVDEFILKYRPGEAP